VRKRARVGALEGDVAERAPWGDNVVGDLVETVACIGGALGSSLFAVEDKVARNCVGGSGGEGKFDTVLEGFNRDTVGGGVCAVSANDREQNS
jgi:hypothetical protein